MNNKTWSFLSNPFETHTRNSNKKMLSISTDTHSKLHAEISDADILVLYNALDPVFQAYSLIYSNYSVVSGERKGKTLDLVTQLEIMKETDLAVWEGKVHNVYAKGTPKEVEIFPRSRTPFLQGTYEQRINAVKALYLKLATDAAFLTLTTEVQSFYNVLLSARDTQQQKEGLIGQLATVREEQRILLADALYSVLGGLMVKFKSNRQQIAHYFDLALLRSKNGDEVLAEYEGSLAAGAFISLGALADGAKKIRLTIVSGGPGEAGLGVINDVFNGNTMALQGPGSIENPVEYFNSAGNIVILHNQNATLPLQYKVEVLG